MRCAARAAMDASRASDASDDDRRDGDADDGVDAAGDVSGVGWSAASGVVSMAACATGPSSGQAAVGPAGHACARMAVLLPTAGSPGRERLHEAAQNGQGRSGGCKQAAHSPLGNGGARMPESAKVLQDSALRAMVRAGLVSWTGLYARRDVPCGLNRLAR